MNNQQKLDFYIKPLSEEAAFNKGVEYFVEVVFFYGVLIGIAVWEVDRSQKASDKLKAEISSLHTAASKNDKMITTLQSEIESSRF